MAEDYDLTWEKHNEASFRAFLELRGRQSLVDVTLYCEGELVRAHKLVLAACSLYFERMFNSLRGDDRNRATVIALPRMDKTLLKLSLDFMYSGKVTVPSEKLQDFMAFAEFLEIRGLRSEQTSSPPPPTAGTRTVATNGGTGAHRSLLNAGFGVGAGKKPGPLSQTLGAKAKAPLKRPFPEAASPVGGGQPLNKVVDPLSTSPSNKPGSSSSSSAPKPKVLKEAQPEAFVKAELAEGDDVDAEYEEFEEAYENYDDVVAAQLGADVDGQDSIPKSIPPSIVPDEPMEKVSTFCWRGRDVGGALAYFCDLCLHVSPSKRDGIRHERRHTGERPYACEQCSSTYTRREHLKRHVKNHHPDAFEDANFSAK